MNEKSWLLPHLQQVLVQHKQTLDNWRKQIPTQQERVKNFENWLIVELVNNIAKEAQKSGMRCEIRTNGHFRANKVKASNVKGLEGTKNKAKHLSADISVRYNKKRIESAEIKTGLSPQEIRDDLRIVKHYNDEHIANQSEFALIVILPEDKKYKESSLKSYNKIKEKVRTVCPNYYTLLPSDETESDWLRFFVAVPNVHK